MASQRTTKNTASEIQIVSDATGYLNLNGGTYPANTDGYGAVSAMNIREIFWSASSTNAWTVQRGANVVAVLTGANHHNYASSGFLLEQGGDAQANVVFSLSGGTGVIGIKLSKQG